jgi:hypothetical protein
MKFMLEDILLKKSIWYQSIGLEEPIAQANSSHPLSSAKPYDPPRVSRTFVRPSFLRCFSTLYLDDGAKKCIGVYDLLQHTSNKLQIAFLSILIFWP